jgi:Fur family ferric uptake transcriptional regulator
VVTLESIERDVARRGYRVTAPRRALLARMQAMGDHFTAEALVAASPGVGRATVFRTLEALVAAGVARRLERDGHVYAYVACRPGHHHHLACSRCGRVEEIGEAYIRPVAERVAAERGFRIDDARLDFYGICARCTAPAG